MHKGKFIALEGSEGVGKTTNLQFIHDYLLDRGIDVLLTREPGGTQLGEKLREILLSIDHGEAIFPEVELLLMFAARSQHLQQVILPALEAGRWVLCDRFTDASYAYQGGGRGLSDKRIAVLENWVQADLRPDQVLLLDAPTEVGIRRAKRRGAADRFEQEELAFFERVRAAYLSRAEADSSRYRVINAALPLTEVQQQIQSALADMI